MSTKQIEKRLSQRTIMILLIAGLAVIIAFTVTPCNIIPTQVALLHFQLAVTEYGCIGESQYGVSVVVPECDAQVGDIVSTTFYVPLMKINGSYDRLNDSVEMGQP